VNLLTLTAKRTLAKAGVVARQQRVAQQRCHRSSMSSKRSFMGSFWGLRSSQEEKHW
jgi:hypothetical protein